MLPSRSQHSTPYGVLKTMFSIVTTSWVAIIYPMVTLFQIPLSLFSYPYCYCPSTGDVYSVRQPTVQRLQLWPHMLIRITREKCLSLIDSFKGAIDFPRIFMSLFFFVLPSTTCIIYIHMYPFVLLSGTSLVWVWPIALFVVLRKREFYWCCCRECSSFQRRYGTYIHHYSELIEIATGYVEGEEGLKLTETWYII